MVKKLNIRKIWVLIMTITLGSLVFSAEAQKNRETVRDANDFTLTDINGKTVQLSSFEGRKIVVLEWTNYDCPFVKAHYSKEVPTSTGLFLKYKDKDVVWLTINSTHYATPEATKAWAEGLKLPQQFLMDADGKVGKLYGAQNTPELFIIDKQGKLVYQGAFDNAPLGKTPEGQPYLNYVDKALEELIAGKNVSIRETKPYGCTVKYLKEPN